MRARLVSPTTNALDNTRLRRSDVQHAAVSALLETDLGDVISSPSSRKRREGDFGSDYVALAG